MSLGQETETDKLWGEGWVLKRDGAWPGAPAARWGPTGPGLEGQGPQSKPSLLWPGLQGRQIMPE